MRANERRENNGQKEKRNAGMGKTCRRIQIALAIYSAVDVVRQKEFKKGSKALWLPIVLFINFLGPLAYFLVGKKK